MMLERDDEPWTDGGRPHPACGYFLDEHHWDGTRWACPQADA